MKSILSLFLLLITSSLLSVPAASWCQGNETIAISGANIYWQDARIGAISDEKGFECLGLQIN